MLGFLKWLWSPVILCKKCGHAAIEHKSPNPSTGMGCSHVDRYVDVQPDGTKTAFYCRCNTKAGRAKHCHWDYETVVLNAE